MDKLTQEEIINLMSNFDSESWAKKSKFYQTVMADGNIFNPYIHRRFLPYQFREILSLAQLYTFGYRKTNGKLLFEKQLIPSKIQIINALKHSYKPAILIKHICKEIELLSFLQKRDKLAYDERSMIWRVDNCILVITDFLDILIRSISLVRRIPNYGISVEDMKANLENWKEALLGANTYADIYSILSSTPENYNFNIMEFVYEANKYKSKLWVSGITCNEVLYDMFLLSGAYYTVKSCYMFDNGVTDRMTKLDDILYQLGAGEQDWYNYVQEFFLEKTK